MVRKRLVVFDHVRIALVNTKHDRKIRHVSRNLEFLNELFNSTAFNWIFLMSPYGFSKSLFSEINYLLVLGPFAFTLENCFLKSGEKT